MLCTITKLTTNLLSHSWKIKKGYKKLDITKKIIPTIAIKLITEEIYFSNSFLNSNFAILTVPEIPKPITTLNISS